MENQNNFARYSDVESVLVYGFLPFKKPKISIVIPTYKRADLLEETLDSAINQTGFDDYDIIVVDNEPEFDAETDTEKLIKKINSDKILYYKNKKNIGMFGNWNRCIELANADWVCILHDDDKLKPEMLKICYPMLNKNRSYIQPEYEIFGNTSNLNYRGGAEGCAKILKERINELLASRNILLPVSPFEFAFMGLWSAPIGVLFSKKNALDIGGYNQDLYPSADGDFAIRYSQKYGIYRLKTALIKYRVEVNATLKAETLLGFIKSDFVIRKKLIENYGKCRKKFFTKLSEILIYQYCYEHELLHDNKTCDDAYVNGRKISLYNDGKNRLSFYLITISRHIYQAVKLLSHYFISHFTFGK
jgi:glycosyltransferase involved in cell wall biosynthesis